LGSPKGSNKFQNSACGPKGLHRAVEQGKLAFMRRVVVVFPRVGPYRNVLKERRLEMERKSLSEAELLPPLPLSPMGTSQPPPAPKAVMQPALKRIDDQDLETYKAGWHVSTRR
jgi:hypothetical protein